MFRERQNPAQPPVRRPVAAFGRRRGQNQKGSPISTNSHEKVLAVASGGGHWVQLRRVIPAFEGMDIVYVTISDAYRIETPHARFHVVNDATRWNKLGILVLGWRMLRIVLRERPDVVFSTGAAPGLLALLFGRLIGARTIWLDSIANAEHLSLSGRLARPIAGLWLTQWENLASKNGPRFEGRIF
jgi:UDP-N-acetylglucosamine:LPS N-acetylglucosamine transferase